MSLPKSVARQLNFGTQFGVPLGTPPVGMAIDYTPLVLQQSQMGVNPAQYRNSTQLEESGVNLPMWKRTLVSTCNDKRCRSALDRPMPGTGEDEAALGIIVSSIPSIWGPHIQHLPTAFLILQWIEAKFVGGFSGEANREWLKMMGRGMLPTEDLAHYVHRLEELRDMLQGNGRPMLDDEFNLLIIKGFPWR